MSDQGDAPLKFDPAANINQFFTEVVSTAADEQGYDTSAESEAYLASLLVDYARPGQALQQFLSEPLGLSLLTALQSPSSDRFNKLRILGDEALFLSGFYSEHLGKRGLELSYTRDLGSTAYDSAAQILRRISSAAQGPDVFSELARKFDMFVNLLSVIADSIHARGASQQSTLVDLYERWRRSGSKVLGDALIGQGLMPLGGDQTLH